MPGQHPDSHHRTYSEIEDCTQEWTFPMEEFDYVHIRYLVGSIADWTALFRQAFQVLKPGAYLESYEATPNTQSDDGTLPPDSALAQWGQLFVDGGRALGRSFTVVEDNVQRRAMEEAGFVDIQERNIKVRLTSSCLLCGCPTFATRLTLPNSSVLWVDGRETPSGGKSGSTPN